MSNRSLRRALLVAVFLSASAASGVLGALRGWPRGPAIGPDPCALSKSPEGPPAPGDAPDDLEIDSRLHGCQRVPYTALRTFLAARGVDMDAAAPSSAGGLYTSAKVAFGVPPQGSRRSEPSFHSTAEATKLFDIFLQAAPEIIDHIADPVRAPACVLDGQSRPMFDVTGACVPESVSCLLGRPATKDDLALCNSLVDKASPEDPGDVAVKQRMAVAVLLGAGHTCE